MIRSGVVMQRYGSSSKPIVMIVQTAMLVAFALVLTLVERLIPFSFAVPGVKLGLANLVIVLGLLLLPFRQALTLVVLKCIMAAWFFGSFSAFLYSLTGSLLSFGVMSTFIYILNQRNIILIISMAGAVFHNLGQLLMAAVVLDNTKVFYYTPVLLLSGIVTGLAIGLGVRAILPYIITTHFKEHDERA